MTSDRFHVRPVTVMLAVLTWSIAVRAEAEGEAEILERALGVVVDNDTFAAMAVLEADAAPAIVAQRYAGVTEKLFNQRKDLARMVMFGRAGIQYCLAKAETLREGEPELCRQLRGAAKSMAYNLGANTWPGWDEAGPPASPSDLAAGLDAARLNLRLALELERDARVMGDAHWLVGAQLLAAGRAEEAAKSFQIAATKYNEAERGDYQAMARGYLGLAIMLQAGRNLEGQRQFDAAISELEKSGNDDGRFFADQLRTARKVFEREENAKSSLKSERR